MKDFVNDETATVNAIVEVSENDPGQARPTSSGIMECVLSIQRKLACLDQDPRHFYQ